MSFINYDTLSVPHYVLVDRCRLLDKLHDHSNEVLEFTLHTLKSLHLKMMYLERRDFVTYPMLGMMGSGNISEL